MIAGFSILIVAIFILFRGTPKLTVVWEDFSPDKKFCVVVYEKNYHSTVDSDYVVVMKEIQTLAETKLLRLSRFDRGCNISFSWKDPTALEILVEKSEVLHRPTTRVWKGIKTEFELIESTVGRSYSGAKTIFVYDESCGKYVYVFLFENEAIPQLPISTKKHSPMQIGYFLNPGGIVAKWKNEQSVQIEVQRINSKSIYLKEYGGIKFFWNFKR